MRSDCMKFRRFIFYAHTICEVLFTNYTKLLKTFTNSKGKSKGKVHPITDHEGPGGGVEI